MCGAGRGIDGIGIRARLSHDESLLLTASPIFMSSPCRLWDLESGLVLREFNAYGGTFGTGGKYLLTFEHDGIRLVDLSAHSTNPKVQTVATEKTLRAFELCSATEITETGEFRLLTWPEWLERKKAAESRSD